MLTHVDLFSGIGGFALAARWAGIETIAFAEIDPYASRVLQRHWPGVVNYGDVRNVPTIGNVWLVTGGVPCQPASVAGKRKGTEDDRWLWPQALAAVERIRPAWVLFENPTGILSLNDGVEFERICLALEGQGYEVQPLVIPACAVNAEHQRNRIWVLAHADEGRKLQQEGIEQNKRRRTSDGAQANASNSNQERHAGRRGAGAHGAHVGELSAGLRPASDNADFVSREHWNHKPVLGRRVHGLPSRLDRIAVLGNSIVPQVVYQLIKRMIEVESNA